MYGRLGRLRQVIEYSEHRSSSKMLPVKHAVPAVDKIENLVIQNPPVLWEIYADHILATYKVFPKNLAEEIRSVLLKAEQHKEFMLSEGISLELSVGNRTILTDRQSSDMVFQAYIDSEHAPGRWNNGKRWRTKEGWITINKSDINLIMDAIAARVETVYAWLELAETSLMQATSVQDLLDRKALIYQQVPINPPPL